jgi:hypothetical protein
MTQWHRESGVRGIQFLYNWSLQAFFRNAFKLKNEFKCVKEAMCGLILERVQANSPDDSFLKWSLEDRHVPKYMIAHRAISYNILYCTPTA